MKVLQINSFCGYGSTGRIATDIYHELSKQGHECLIAYGRGTAPEGINSYRIGTKFDNYLHVAKTRIFDEQGFASKQATKQLIKQIKEYQPDVIHLHNLHGYYLHIGILFTYLATLDIPIKWTLHDCWAFTGHCSHFDHVGCNKWQTECEKCPQKKEYPKSLIMDNSKENYARKKQLFTSIKNLTLITPSKWLENKVKQSYFSIYQVKTIHNGIDLSIFRPTTSDFREQNGLKNKKIILGVASVWETRKGFDDFIELAKKLDDSFQVVLVGVSKKQLQILPKNIFAIERTNNIQELASIYNTADIFVNPTYEEVLGLTNLEAIACETPTITYDSGGSPECITSNTGRITKAKNTDSIIQEIKMLLLPEVHFDNAYLVEKFEKQTQVAKYIEAYKEV